MRDVAILRDRTTRTFAALTRTPGEDLRWVTTIIAAYVVAAEDDLASAVCEAVQAYHRERRTALRRGGYVRRHHDRDHTRWAGVIEIDLLRAADEYSNGKKRLLSALGVEVDQVHSEQRVLVLHEHAVMDVRGHESVVHLMRDLRDAFPGYRRLHCDTLRAYETSAQIKQNMHRLAGYTTKMRYQYADAMNGTPTKFTDRYEPEWRVLVEQLYDAIGVERMIDTNITVQSSENALDKMYVFDQNDEIEILENTSKQPILVPKQRQNGVFEPFSEISKTATDSLQLSPLRESSTDPHSSELTNTCSRTSRPSVQDILARVRRSQDHDGQHDHRSIDRPDVRPINPVDLPETNRCRPWGMSGRSCEIDPIRGHAHAGDRRWVNPFTPVHDGQCPLPDDRPDLIVQANLDRSDLAQIDR